MTTIEIINERLKAAKIGVYILPRGNRLSLRGTLPPKTRLGETKPSQRTIALHIYNSPAGLKGAKKKALEVGGLLASGEFDWSDWEDWDDTPELSKYAVSEWVQRFETDYFSKRARTPKSGTTWKTDFKQPFGQLPPDELLTEDLLLQSILTTQPDTRDRLRRCTALGRLAKFAGLEVNTTALRGNYSPKRVTPRNLPTDKEISEWRDRIPNPQWQYAFGLMACYGLRNHELFHIDLEKLRNSPVLNLTEDNDGGGKTGARRVWACYPEWWDKWHLWDVSLLPQVTGDSNAALGGRVTNALKRYGFSKPYNLRHAWAVRTIEFDIPVELAAQQMGHSVSVHSETYHAWISEGVHQRAFDRALQRPDRPLPP
jgi:hypothetical protein